MNILGSTVSACPQCLVQTDAFYELDADGGVTLRGTCPQHGDFHSLIWRGLVPFEHWRDDLEQTPPCQDGDYDIWHCCSQSTCCALLEVTSRCNAACPICFANAKGDADQQPPLAGVLADIDRLASSTQQLPTLQLSGGEPTCRDDLPQVIAYARQKGFPYIQLNTNGIRLAQQQGYAHELADSGLSYVFLQFDGLDDQIYRKLRGRDALQQKLQAIDACGDAGLGVALVPTVVRGVNTHCLGDIIRFAVGRSPVVRGVHFQPATFSGRSLIGSAPSDEQRLTLDELLASIYAQCDGLVNAGDLTPSRCDHPMCGFHAAYIVAPDGTLMGPSKPQETQGRHRTSAAQNREFVGRRWTRASAQAEKEACCCDPLMGLTTMDGLLARARTHAFTITAMAFQDRWSIDARRLERCSLHVLTDDGLVPFCQRYL